MASALLVGAGREQEGLRPSVTRSLASTVREQWVVLRLEPPSPAPGLAGKGMETWAASRGACVRALNSGGPGGSKLPSVGEEGSQDQAEGAPPD